MTMNTPALAPLGSTGLTRRRLLAGLVALPTLAAVVAACGDDTVDGPAGTSPGTNPGTSPGTGDTATGIAHPTGADDVVVRIAYEGGFVPMEYLFVNQPTLLVSGDGRVFTPQPVAAIYPGPLVWPMSVRTISEAGIQTLLGLARDRGLLAPPPDYSTDDPVVDAPDTVVTITTADGTWVHRAYALALGGAPENSDARRALAEFVAVTSDLSSAVGAAELGPESTHEPDQFRLRATVTDEATLGGIEPAPTIVDWPSDIGLALADASDCGRVSAEAAGQLLADATQITYFRDGGAVYGLAVAGVLPGDPAC
jgi:hypothetical protein